MFRFKQFTVRQERAAMKVGTDGVLLGAWADLEDAGTILDVGTGTGVIALMAAQRNPQAVVDALDIDAEACLDARENAEASPWKERIRVFDCALQEFEPGRKYDCVVCNPPFFVRSTQTPDERRTLARHCATLSHEELAEHAARLLSPTGCFCTILPVTETGQLTEYARRAGLFPKRVTYVHPTPAKAPKRILTTFVKQEATPAEEHLVVEVGRLRYSEAYTALTKDFYLYL